MLPSRPISPTRGVAITLAGVTAAVLALFVVVFAAHRVVTPMDDLKELVDIGGEGNLPTWWNSTLLTLTGVAATVAGFTVPPHDSAERRGWWVVAVAALYLSLDEAAGLHERLDAVVDAVGIDPPTYAWMIPGSLLAAVAVMVLMRFCRPLPVVPRRRLASALGMYAVGALGLEGINGWIREQDWSAVYTLGLIVEEAVEMSACVLAAVTIADVIFLRRSQDSRSVAAVER